jgi:glyoxylase-like metal-dependent hydrolase (beta-lactamase superfamily II)
MMVLRGRNRGKFPPSYSVLILDDQTVLIDTGCGIDVLRALKERYDIDYVINSHSHPDHSCGNWVLDKPVYVPEEARKVSGSIEALSLVFADESIVELTQGYMRDMWEMRDFTPAGTFSNTTVFDFGQTRLRAIHTPGHSHDHYCFFEENSEILLSVDYDLTNFPWYALRESSIKGFLRSAHYLKALSPCLVMSSHRGIIADDIEAEFDRYCGIIELRNSRIFSLLKVPLYIEQLTDQAPIYGSFPYMKPLLRYWEKQMLTKHLELMEHEGRVEKEGGLYHRSA